MTEYEPKRSRWDKFFDRIPVFGRMRRIKGWMRRKKGWVYFALILVILFIVKPVLTILAEVFKIFRPMISAIFDNPAGRFIFYNLLALLLLWWMWRKIRAGIFRVVGMRRMRNFLDGMNAMLMGHWRKAIPSFKEVVKTPRWIKLQDAVPEHRDIRVDSYIKIAMCHLRLGEANEAKNWLLRVREADMLTEHVRRNHAELRALSYDLNDELEGETVLRELSKTQDRDRGNRRVLLALRDRHEAAGNLDQAKTFAKKLAAVSVAAEKEQAEAHLALLEFRSAHKALGEGDKKTLMKSLKARSGDVRSALMLGDLALEDNNTAAALKAWSRAVSVPVFDRIAGLLESGKLSGDKERELLLKHFPYAGTMIVLAEHHRKKGEFGKAKAAIEKVLEAGGADITVLRLYAACLEGEGDTEQAAELYRRALSMSLG